MHNSAGRSWPLRTWWTGSLIGLHTKRLRNLGGLGQKEPPSRLQCFLTLKEESNQRFSVERFNSLDLPDRRHPVFLVRLASHSVVNFFDVIFIERNPKHFL